MSTTGMRSLTALLLLGLAVTLLACSDDDPVPLTGYFVDSPVQGVTFETDTQNGTTGADGAFLYFEGEVITFSVGQTVLGSTVAAKEMMTPQDLVPGVVLPITQRQVDQFWNAFWSSGKGKSKGPISPDAELQFRLMNILSLLQSMDADKVETNGIVIDPDWGVVLNNVAVDFDQPSRDFERDGTVRGAIAQGSGQSLTSGPEVVHPLMAFDRFCASQGLSPQVYIQSEGSSDNDADGTPDSSWVNTVDSRGFVTGYENDNDADGTPDSISQYVIDDFGRWIAYESDNDADGTVDYRSAVIYDSLGNRVREETDDNADGTIDSITHYTYDADGNQTSYQRDNDADGTVEYAYNYFYDANGHQIRYEYDNNADGTPDQITTYEYDSSGNQIRREEDSDADGTLDRITTHEYDSNGYRTRQEQDNDADGTTDRVYAYEYDANGNQTRYERDDDADGTPDRIYTYTYNANGDQTQYINDSDADGTPDRIETNIYGTSGLRVRREIDSDADGTPDRIYSYQWDWATFMGYYSWD